MKKRKKRKKIKPGKKNIKPGKKKSDQVRPCDVGARASPSSSLRDINLISSRRLVSHPVLSLALCRCHSIRNYDVTKIISDQLLFR